MGLWVSEGEIRSNMEPIQLKKSMMPTRIRFRPARLIRTYQMEKP